MMDILAIQRALKEHGFDPGPLDGAWGRRTIAAVREFQAERALWVKWPGTVGPQTLAKLFAGAGEAEDKLAPLPWHEEARRLMGVREKPGAASNPIIMDWADDLDLHYSGDDVAWCGLMVAHCIGATLPEEPLPTNPLGARNWLKWGREVEPTVGAVLVFCRGKRDGWQGHVGFYAAERKDAYKVLGGNQSDSVSEAWIAKDRLLGARWPISWPLPAGERVEGGGEGELSQNEA